MLRRAFALALLGATTMAACGSGFLDRLFVGGPDAGATIDVPDARCSLLHVPPPPGIDDTSAAGTVFLAFEALRLDDILDAHATLASPVGLDLDDRCSCPEPPSCRRPAAPGEALCDPDGGIDNASAGLLGLLSTFGFDPDFATKEIAEGEFTGLLTITGWNRTPDDPRVTVALYTSRGLEGAIDGGGARPARNGLDRWSIDPESVGGGDASIGVDCAVRPGDCVPVRIDDKAYVAGGTLVTTIDAPLRIASKAGEIVIELVGARLVGKLDPVDDGGRFTLEGEITGRWPVNRVLEGFARVPYRGSTGCERPAELEFLKQQVCGAVDLASNPSDDSKDLPCDAISTAVRFRAGSAVAGVVRRKESPGSACQSVNSRCD